jgi:iron complex transport system ATP-binding protein
MLEVNNLSVVLGRRRILESVSLTAARGKISALIGPNGAGKSTLLKAIVGLVKSQSGQIDLGGDSLKLLSRRSLAKTAAYLPQNTSPVPSSVFDCILLGRKPHLGFRPSLSDYAMVEKMLIDFNLWPLKDSCVTRISGGEFQKVLIARSLVQNAPIMLLDEPINHLDIKNQLEIMDLVSEQTKGQGLITLIVLHDLNFALCYAENLVLLNNGRIIFNGSPGELNDEELKKAYQVDLKITSVLGHRRVIF